MNVATLGGVLRARAALRSHDRWTRDELLAHQARALHELRSFAVASSPFYRQLHRGLDDAPLEALPIVTKPMVMERFDEVVTDRAIRLADVEAYLEHATATDTFRGRYRVAATGGTTGRREDNRAVPAGQFGAKLLVTVLFSRTQPLIRYELSDHVKTLDGTCPDGLPFGLLGGIEGRQEDLLTLGGIVVHPHVFHAPLESVAVAGWQVIDEGDRLRLLLARPSPGVDSAAVAGDVVNALEGVGVRGIPVETAIVEEIPRTALGKAPLVRRAAPQAH